MPLRWTARRRYGSFSAITLPLSKSILMILAMLSFVGLWKDFLLPLLVLHSADLQPVTVGLYNLAANFPLNLQLVAAFIAMVPPLIATIFMQRRMHFGITMGGIKG